MWRGLPLEYDYGQLAENVDDFSSLVNVYYCRTGNQLRCARYAQRELKFQFFLLLVYAQISSSRVGVHCTKVDRALYPGVHVSEAKMCDGVQCDERIKLFVL